LSRLLQSIIFSTIFPLFLPLRFFLAQKVGQSLQISLPIANSSSLLALFEQKFAQFQFQSATTLAPKSGRQTRGYK